MRVFQNCIKENAFKNIFLNVEKYSAPMSAKGRAMTAKGRDHERRGRDQERQSAGP